MLTVLDRDVELSFGFEDLLRYHGPHAPGGVAHAYKAMERAFPLLGDPVHRREVVVRTAFGGPGARDAFEAVLRAVTGERYVVDLTLGRPELGPERERFVFELRHRGAAVCLAVRDGFVSREFIELARRSGRSDEEEARLDVLKREMADRVMAAPAGEVYDVT
jgi:hypothetical protein